MDSILSEKEAKEQIAQNNTKFEPNKFIVALLGKADNEIYLQYNDKFVKTFSTENKCDPKNIDEFNNFLSTYITKSLKEEKTLILIIAGHGCNSKDNYKMMFDEYGEKFIIETGKITEGIKDLRKRFPKFKCVGLIQACYSNYFDISCFDASITLGNGVSRWNLLLKSLLDSINKEQFTLGDIFLNLTYHLKVASSWQIMGQDNSGLDLKNAKINNNYSFIQNLSE